MMTAALGAGLVVAGCGGGGGSAGSDGGGGFTPGGAGSGPAGASPNGFRFTELTNSTTLTLPTRNKSQKRGAKLAWKSASDASSKFQAFTGAIELTNGQKIYFNAIDDKGIVALYEGTLDFTGSTPKITAIHRVMGQGDVLPDGTSIADIGRGQANAEGTYVTVIRQQDAPPAIYIGSSDNGFAPFAQMGDPVPGGGGSLGGDFNNIGIDDHGNIAYVASYTPTGTAQNHQGLAYVIQNDPNHPGSGILISTRDVTPDGLGSTGGLGLFGLSGNGHFVAQTTINGGPALGGGINGGGTTTPSPSPSPSPLTVTAVTLTPPNARVLKGAAGQMRASATYSDGSVTDVTSTASWTSSDPTVATVSNKGVVTGVAAGSVTITATVGAVSATAKVQVQAFTVYMTQSTGTVGVVQIAEMNGASAVTTPNSLNLVDPRGVAIDSQGRIYISDSPNNRIVRVDNIAGANPLVMTPGLQSPLGIAVDRTGRIYVADSGNQRIIRFDDMTGANPVAYSTGLNQPVDVAIDAAGRILIADSIAWKVFRIDDMTGTNSIAFPAVDAGTMNAVQGVFVDSAGRIYGAATGNSTVVRIDDMTGANLITYNTGLAGPNDVAVDLQGRIYFTDNAGLSRMDDMLGTNVTRLTGFEALRQLAVTPATAADLLPAPTQPAQASRPEGVNGLPNAVVVTGTIGKPSSRKVVAAPKTAALNPLLKTANATVDGTAIYGPRITSGGVHVTVLHIDESHMVLYYGDKLVAQTGGRSPLGNNIASFSPPVCGGDNRIYYVLICVETAELVMYDGTQAKTILARGDKVGTRVVNGINFGLNRNQADASDRLVLIVEYDDGTSGIVVGTPV